MRQETFIPTEQNIQNIYSSLKEYLEQNNFVSSQFKLVENQTNWAIYYFTSLICSIKTSGNTKHITFDIKHRGLFDNSFTISQIKSDPSHFRVHIDSVQDLLNMKEQITKIIDSVLVPCTFDVCSRFNECSDQKKCVHPDPVHAKECGYKRKLDQGIIFYGKNRNID